MLRSIGLPELILLLAVCVLMFAPIAYLLTLRKALSRCLPPNRTMEPEMVWLLLIPLFGLIWHFIIVNKISESLRNEYHSRNWQIDSTEPGKSLGLAMCILPLFSWIPLLGLLTAIAGMVCWITYWVKIANYSAPLAMVAQLPPSPPTVPYRPM